MRIRHYPLATASDVPRLVRRRSGFEDCRKGQGGRPKLTDTQVRAMRRAGDWAWPPDFIASLFGVSIEYARLVMHGETHAHVR